MTEDRKSSDLYELIWAEIEGDRQDKGLWAVAFAENDGDPRKTQAAYIRMRAAELGVRDGETDSQLDNSELSESSLEQTRGSEVISSNKVETEEQRNVRLFREKRAQTRKKNTEIWTKAEEVARREESVNAPSGKHNDGVSQISTVIKNLLWYAMLTIVFLVVAYAVMPGLFYILFG
jgi:hypothetical protein